MTNCINDKKRFYISRLQKRFCAQFGAVSDCFMMQQFQFSTLSLHNLNFFRLAHFYRSPQPRMEIFKTNIIHNDSTTFFQITFTCLHENKNWRKLFFMFYVSVFMLRKAFCGRTFYCYFSSRAFALFISFGVVFNIHFLRYNGTQRTIGIFHISAIMTCVIA